MATSVRAHVSLWRAHARNLYPGPSSLLLAGCATRSTEITAACVSPIQYQSYSCTQLREEAARVSARAAIASGAQDQNATNDAVATGVALVTKRLDRPCLPGERAAGMKTRCLNRAEFVVVGWRSP